jgi:phosphoribosylformylglycinamidine cyclo-ligase
VVEGIVEGLAAACKAQGCTLVGGETSEQPGVVPNGTYILTASVVGIVEKARIIDGSKIRVGDTVLAVSSNGLHTNGYSLVRKLIEEKPEILKEQVGGESFLDVILKPHTCYYHALRDLFALPELHGMAHITGGGIGGNLNRILPKGTAAAIDLAKICMLPIFGLIKRYGGVPDADMLQTYNLGIGLTLVIDSSGAEHITAHLKQYGHTAYSIGEIVAGGGEVRFNGALQW